MQASEVAAEEGRRIITISWDDDDGSEISVGSTYRNTTVARIDCYDELGPFAPLPTLRVWGADGNVCARIPAYRVSVWYADDDEGAKQ